MPSAFDSCKEGAEDDAVHDDEDTEEEAASAAKLMASSVTLGWTSEDPEACEVAPSEEEEASRLTPGASEATDEVDGCCPVEMKLLRLDCDPVARLFMPSKRSCASSMPGR